MSGNWSDLERPPLRQEQLRRALVVPGGFYRDITVVDETGSTNRDLVEQAGAGIDEGVVLVAEAQHAGRGRLDRVWSAPRRAALTFSVLLRPTFDVGLWSWLPLMAAVAVAQPLNRLSGLDVRLKWPNDVLIAERKVGGILTQRVDDAAVVGVGLNVSQRADELPGDFATSLVMSGSTITDRDPVFRAVLRSIARAYTELCAVAGDAEKAGLRAAYLELCSTVNREVRVELPGGSVVEGTAVDVDAAGLLVVASAGQRRSLAAGDVVHVR